MGWPQIAMIVFLSISLLINAHDHGKPKTGRDSFWHALIGLGLIATLLTLGGFWHANP